MSDDTALVLKRGDTKPDLVVTITDPVATFGSVASWRVLIRRGTDLFDDTTPGVDTSTAGTAIVTHLWAAEETDTAAGYGAPMKVEVEATWPDGAVQTFPADTYRRVVIIDDLG